MEDLEIIKLYENANKNKMKKFIESAESDLKVQIDKKCITSDSEWMDLTEEVIPHLDSIFRKPNRFIKNEEEVVKIEQTRKVSVESIKHLSKNTNFIQKIDEQTGDVIPSKLLNVRKEESYDTYENRLAYTLIQNMKFFINKRKTILEKEAQIEKENNNKNEDSKQLEYNAKSKLNDEDIDINVSISSKLDSQITNSKERNNIILERISEIERQMTDIESTDVYKILDSSNVLLVREPIRKTNVILKNVHFQYVMKLWEYLKDFFEEQNNIVEECKDYMDNGKLKNMMDEAFLLQYLAMKTLDEDETEKKEIKKQVQTIVLEQMIDKMLDLDENITEEQLQQMVAEKYEVIKYKKMAILQDIQKIFKKHIEQYEVNVETKG